MTNQDKTPTARDTRPSDFSTTSGVYRYANKIEKKANRTTIGVVVLGVLGALHEAGVFAFLKSVLLSR
jgi:hypothetical protein